MKKCSRCKIEKPLEEFVKNKHKHDGYSTYCKECKRIKDNDFYKSSESRRIQVKVLRDKQAEENKEIISLARINGCILCGEKEPITLDFHHLNPEEKDFEIAKMRVFSSKKLKKELLKCVVLCANCHRKVHANILRL